MVKSLLSRRSLILLLTCCAGTPLLAGDAPSILGFLRPHGTMGGTVRDSSGAPLANAEIYFATVADPAHPENLQYIAKTKTDAAGAWSQARLPKDSTLSLTVDLAGHRGFTFIPSAKTTPTLDDLFAQKAGFQLGPSIEITGTVLFEGKPVPRAEVALRAAAFGKSYNCETDEAGRFHTFADGEGKGYAFAATKDLAPKLLEFKIDAAKSEPLVIRLDTGHPIKGKLVLRPQGMPKAAIPTPDVPIMLGSPFSIEKFGLALKTPLLIATTNEAGEFVWLHAPREAVECQAFLADGNAPANLTISAKDDHPYFVIGR